MSMDPDPSAATPLEEFNRRLDAAREERRPPRVPSATQGSDRPLIGADGAEVNGNVVSAPGGRKGDDARLDTRDYSVVVNGFPGVQAFYVEGAPRYL